MHVARKRKYHWRGLKIIEFRSVLYFPYGYFPNFASLSDIGKKIRKSILIYWYSIRYAQITKCGTIFICFLFTNKFFT